MYPSEMILIDSCLLYFRPGGCVAKEISLTDGTDKGPVWHLGNGPNEFIGPFFGGQNTIDSTLSIYDITLRRLNRYKWGKENGQLTFKPIEQQYRTAGSSVSRTIRLDNGYIVSQAFGHNGDVLVLQKSDFEIITNFCNPLDIETPLKWQLGGRFASLGNRFVYAAIYFGYIGCFEITDQGTIIKHWEYMLSEPVYDIVAGEFKIDHSKNKEGFSDVKMTDKYVYCLYMGLTPDYTTPQSPETVLIFDHQANPVAQLKLDRQCARFAVSQDNKTMYAAEWMDGNLVRYDLSNIIK